MNAFSPAAAVITGERLQQLADVSILTDPIARFHRNLDRLPIHRCVFAGTLTDFTVEGATLPGPLRQAEVIFVYTHLLAAFFEKIFPRLERPFILLSHNSDEGVSDRFLPVLEDRRIFRWFAQNLCADHEKLVSWPLGAANAQWPHGRMDLLHRVALRRPEKTGFIYMNFDIRTNPARRGPVFERLRAHPLVTVSAGLSYAAYLEELAAHHFCVCPPGNGLDCHRIWECIYLGVIPLVSAQCRLRGLDTLPILYVDDWGRIDADYLSGAYRQLARRRIDLAPAFMDHWQAAIDRERDRLRRALAAEAP